MRLLERALRRSDWGPALARAARVLLEVALWTGVVAWVELLGDLSRDDGADLVFLLTVASIVVVISRIAARGHLPLTRRIGVGIADGARRLVGSFSVPASFAFRLPDDPAPRSDGRLQGLVTLLVVAGLLGALVGGRWLDGLQALRGFSYTIYLLALAVPWALFGLVIVFAWIFGAQWFGASRREQAAKTRGPGWRLLPWFVPCVAVVIAFSYLPGIVSVGLVLAFSAYGEAALGAPQASGYHLWRRDRQGHVVAMGLDTYIRRNQRAAVAFLLFVTLWAAGPRMFDGRPPWSPFTFTIGQAVGVMVAAPFLTWLVGAWTRRFLRPAGGRPEVPLRPTLWWPTPRPDASWVSWARDEGWRVALDRDPPDGGYDLAVEVDGDAAVASAPDGLSRDDATFRLRRRFHVVKRREFRRRLRSLFKEVTRSPRPPGVGYLLCPHAWPIPGIVRDGGAESEGDPAFGGALIGRPFSAAFSDRLRRYLHGVLRAADIDAIYWDDGVRWAELKAVFGILFECYDQGRHPVRARHFLGLPRLRVLIQEPSDVDPAVEATETGPLPARGRFLLIRRDEGGDPEVPEPAAPSHGIREPVGV